MSAFELFTSTKRNVYTFLALVISVHAEANQVDLVVVDSEVLWLHISVNVAPLVKVLKTPKHTNAYLTKIQSAVYCLQIGFDTVLQILHDYEIELLS